MGSPWLAGGEGPAKAARSREASPAMSADSTAVGGSCSDEEVEPLPEPEPSVCRGPAVDPAAAPWEEVHGRLAAALRRVAEREDLREEHAQGHRRRGAAPAPAPRSSSRGRARLRASTAAWREVSGRLAAAMERATTEAASLEDDEEWL